jgi:menaquinone-dependent protoporphyrinogen oxidase
MDAKLSRRRFLRTGVLAAAAAGVALCGGTTFAITYEPKIDLPSTYFGEKAVNNRILIAYASKAGSTAEIAAHMGETLAKASYSADVLPVKSPI